MSTEPSKPPTDGAGRVVVVTGGARGIGRVATELLAEAGFRVVVAVRDPAAADLPAGPRIRVVGCDVADAVQVASLFAGVDRIEGALHALVNNAGVIAPIGRITDTDPQAWAQAIAINLTGAYHCIHAALPRLVAAGGGIIVNISSGAAHRPLEGWSAYCASKAGLAMLTRSIHDEYGAQGVHALGLLPGTVDTGMQVSIRASGINRVSQLPRSALASPLVPARAIVALCKGAASRYAGTEVDVRDPAVAALLLGA